MSKLFYDKFKYKSVFDSVASFVQMSEHGELSVASSLEPLRQLFPSNIDIKNNPDLLYFVAPGAVGNYSNKNADLVGGADIVKMAPLSVNKYLTVEHSRKNGAQGAISGYGFSKFGSHEIISSEEASQLNTPFNWIVLGHIYEVLNPGLVNYLINSSADINKKSPPSLSWEIFFSDYQILLGDKDLSKGQIISPADKNFSELDKYLKSSGGTGSVKETNEPVYRLIVGDMLPGGFSITNTPAAEVKGILTITDGVQLSSSDIENLEKSKSKESGREVIDLNIDTVNTVNEIDTVKQTQDIKNLELSAAQIEEKNDNLEKNIKNIITQKKNSVNNNTNLNNSTKQKKINIYMKFKSIKDITAEKFTALAGEQAAFISEELNEFFTDYAQKLDVTKKEVEAKENEVKQLKASADSLEKQMKDIQSKLDASEQARATEKEKNDLNLRINDLTSKFELNEKGVQAVAKQIKGLSDEKYTEWLEFAESTFAAKKAAPMKDDDNDADSEDDNDEDDAKDAKSKKAKKAKDAKASEDEEFDFENIKKKDGQVIARNLDKERNLANDFKTAFADWEKEFGLEVEAV